MDMQNMTVKQGNGAIWDLLEKQGCSPENVTLAELRRVGRMLGDYLGRKPYTGNYVHMLLKGQPVSRKVNQAIAGLLAGETAQTTEVRVITSYDLDGVIVDVEPRACKRTGCGKRFIPHSWNHKYCSTDCRKAARK